MPKPSLIFSIIVLLAQAQATIAETGGVNVEAGDISAIAQGENAKATITIGEIPRNQKIDCAAKEIKVGNIQKQAIGRNATAQINISETRCEEKKP